MPGEIGKRFLEWMRAERNKADALAGPILVGAMGIADDPQFAICFAIGTPVLNRRGHVPIEQVAEGDEVLAVPDCTPLARSRWCQVERVYRNNPAELINVHREGGGVIRATLNHPFLVRARGFVAAQHLRPGDLLRTDDDRWAAVGETTRNGEIEPMYNLRVADCRTYFAGGVLVHNESPGDKVREPGKSPIIEPPEAANNKKFKEWENRLDNTIQNKDGKTQRTDFNQFKTQRAQSPGSTIAIQYFAANTPLAYLYASIDINKGNLEVTLRKGQPGWGDSFAHSVRGTPGDQDSVQVAVQWGPAGLLDTNAHRNNMAADWNIDKALTGDGLIYGNATTQFVVPQNATRVKVVLVYTDLYASPQLDAAGVIASWTGTRSGQSWHFTVNQDEVMRWYGPHLAKGEEAQKQSLNQTRKVLGKMGFKLVERKAPPGKCR